MNSPQHSMHPKSDEITLLSGGLGQEVLKRASAEQAHPLWSVHSMMEEPEAVRDAHLAYIEAGSKVLTLNTYTATPTRLSRFPDMPSIERIHQRAGQLAHEAVAASGCNNIQIAGCLPPLVASYVSEVAKPFDASKAEYLELIQLQADYCDLFLIETISNTTEARAALAAAAETGIDVCMGFTIRDNLASQLRSNEPLGQALAVLAEQDLLGVVLNCSSPEAITNSLPLLRQTGFTFGAYANGFETTDPLAPGTTVDSLSTRLDITPESYAETVMGWVELGARIVGGCCEIGPAHICLLNQRLIEQGYRVCGFPHTGQYAFGA